MRRLKKMARVKLLPYIDVIDCAGCGICIESCPKDCLVLTKPKYRGDIRTVAQQSDKDACIGCGICAKACPIEAITMVKPGVVPKKSHSARKETRCSKYIAGYSRQ